MVRILRTLRACGLIIVFSIALVLAATAYILFSDSLGAQQSVTVPTVAGSETRQGEATSLFDTATPIPPTSAPLFVTSTPIPVAETPIAPSPISIPPSATPVPPSRTPLPPTATRVPPTRTPIPPSATAILPSPTPVPPSRTPLPPTVTEIPPTATDSFPLTMYSSPLRKYVRGVVNLRQGPGTSYSKIGLLTAGTQLEVIGQSGDWYLVMHNHGEAFIAGWLAYDIETSTPTPAPTATRASPTKQTFPLTRYSQPLRRFTHGTVNLRQGPDTTYDKVGSVPASATLRVYGRSGDWYLIKRNGRDAFIAGWLTYDMPTVTPVRRTTSVHSNSSTSRTTIRRFSTPRRKYVHGTVNLRRGPGTSHFIVGKLPAGATLQALGQSGDWYLIKHNGRDAYIASWLAHSSPPPAQQAAQQSSAPQQPSYSCNCSKTCGAMSSCREAYFQLNNCGCRRRDGDNDGVPCESICR